MRIKWVIDKIEEKEGQFCRINNVLRVLFFLYMYIFNGNILFMFHKKGVNVAEETQCTTRSACIVFQSGLFSIVDAVNSKKRFTCRYWGFQCLYFYVRNFNLLPRAVVFQLNLKYLHVKNYKLNLCVQQYKQIIALFVCDIWHKNHQ